MRLLIGDAEMAGLVRAIPRRGLFEFFEDDNPDAKSSKVAGTAAILLSVVGVKRDSA
jgi:hypothetical protein